MKAPLTRPQVIDVVDAITALRHAEAFGEANLALALLINRLISCQPTPEGIKIGITLDEEAWQHVYLLVLGEELLCPMLTLPVYSLSDAFREQISDYTGVVLFGFGDVFVPNQEAKSAAKAQFARVVHLLLDADLPVTAESMFDLEGEMLEDLRSFLADIRGLPAPPV